MNIRFRADIDADRRPVQDQQARLGIQPFGDDHLLRVAAGKGTDRRFGAFRVAADFPDSVDRIVQHHFLVDSSVDEVFPDRGRGRILLDRAVQEKSLRQAVFGNVADPVSDRVVDRADFNFFPVQEDFPAGRGRDAEKRVADLAPT